MSKRPQIYLHTIVVFLFSLIFLAGQVPAISADRVYLDIAAAKTRKFRIAVPWLGNEDLEPGAKQLFGKELAETLGDALTFHGIIDVIPGGEYGGDLNSDWKGLKADYVVLGKYSVETENIKLELRLLDVGSNDMIMGKSFYGRMDQKENMLYKYCDNVIETLTGHPGIADSRIAFVNRQGRVKEVCITDILGKTFRQVTRHKHLVVSPRFVPETPYLSYTSYHTGNQNLYITDLRQDKTTRALSRRKGLNLGPAWSKGGQDMILTLSMDGNPDLYRLDNRGEIIEQLTSKAGINVSPTLSPDGNHMVFVSDRSGKPQLYHMDLRTRQVRRLTFEGSENSEPNWSPVEDKVVFSSLRGGIYQLCMLNPLVDGPATQMTTDQNQHESPSFSPDGNQVIFSKRNGNTNQIYAIMKDGSFQRRLFRFNGSQTYPQWSR